MAKASTNTPAGRRIRGLDADQRRAQRRDALLDAALDLFAEQGYLGTSIEQICQRAYVGTKSFYEVFDSRESCYVALLRRITEQAMAHMAAVLDGAPDAEPAATRILIEAFGHWFADDVRLAKVTFGEGSAITPAVEQQRRANRRRAAEFIESIWQRYGGSSGRTRGVAVGVVGGLFEIVADWVHDADVSDEKAVATLIHDLISFYGATRAGMQPGSGTSEMAGLLRKRRLVYNTLTCCTSDPRHIWRTHALRSVQDRVRGARHGRPRRHHAGRRAGGAGSGPPVLRDQ